jgi:hypothetical protein
MVVFDHDTCGRNRIATYAHYRSNPPAERRWSLQRHRSGGAEGIARIARMVGWLTGSPGLHEAATRSCQPSACCRPACLIANNAATAAFPAAASVPGMSPFWARLGPAPNGIPDRSPVVWRRRLPARTGAIETGQQCRAATRQELRPTRPCAIRTMRLQARRLRDPVGRGRHMSHRPPWSPGSKAPPLARASPAFCGSWRRSRCRRSVVARRAAARRTGQPSHHRRTASATRPLGCAQISGLAAISLLVSQPARRGKHNARSHAQRLGRSRPANQYCRHRLLCLIECDRHHSRLRRSHPPCPGVGKILFYLSIVTLAHCTERRRPQPEFLSPKSGYDGGTETDIGPVPQYGSIQISKAPQIQKRLARCLGTSAGSY